MQGGPVDEFLDVAVERPALDQLEVEVGRTLEDRVQSGLTGDHREERHLDAVDQTGGHQPGSSDPPSPCITPSTETCVTVVSFNSSSFSLGVVSFRYMTAPER